MENASKALLMAAGVLIGLLVISLAVYLFVSFGMTSAEIHKEQQEQQLEQFNVQFTSYVGKEGLTIYDVVTVANLATENNKNYELTKKVADGTDYYISVQVANQGFIEKGYNADKIRTIGLGTGYPLEKNSKKGSLKNRRVEIYGFRTQS